MHKEREHTWYYLSYFYHAFHIINSTNYTLEIDSDLTGLWDEDKDKLYLLDLNTQPGMTQTSLVPEQVSFCNLSMHHLITLLIEAAQCD